MSDFLQRLGEVMFKLKWWVVAAWVGIVLILGIIVSQVGFTTSSSISIPGTQAQQALERFNELFPDTGAQSAKVVVAAPEGKVIEDFQPQITQLTKDIAGTEGVTTSVSPFENPMAISENHQIGFVMVQMQGSGDDGQVSSATAEAIQKHINTARTNDLTVEVGGDLVSQSVGEILGVGEVLGVAIALLVLVVTLGSLIAAGMPIVTALIAIAVSMAGLFSLSQVIDLTNTAPVLAVMLGLAVGIDYSLFIINRYRTFLKEGYEMKAAAGRALATAGNAVVFAAVTVIIALAALAVVQIPFMTVMGLAAAATVGIAAIVALTLVPALLGITGLFIFGRKERARIKKGIAKKKVHAEQVSHSTIWYRWGELLVTYRKTTLLVATAVIIALAWPISSLQLGLPTDETASHETSQRKAYDLLVEGFGAGYNAPLLLVAEGLPATSEADASAVREAALAQFQTQLATQAAAQGLTVEQLQALTPPEQLQAGMAQLEQQVTQYAPYYQLQLVAERIGKVDGVQQALPALTTDNGTKGVIQVTPTTGPSDTATQALVEYFRNTDNIKTLGGNDSVVFGVTGTTAMQIDINKKLADALPVYLGVVVGLSFLILLVAFRSVLIPIKATLGFLLSVVAMFGALVAVFQWGWFGIAEAPAPIVSFIPIIAIGILFGLAMDYEFFLVSGMQEAFHHNKKHPKQAVIRGFALGSRVVVAAALIMVSVFAGFITNHDSTIQSIGFALALGVFVDAFIVRLIIVPIVMSYLGKAAWWLPKWLDKILPNVSIEGK